ncbi:MAG: hypothetical protein AAGE94_11460 [Acidobacteriota bacterium]
MLRSEPRQPPDTPRPPLADLPGPAADGSASDWDVAELDTAALALPAAATRRIEPVPATGDRRRLLVVLAVVLVIGSGVAAWRLADWWHLRPSSPADSLANFADSPQAALEAEQGAFRERSRRRAVDEAANNTFDEPVMLGSFGAVEPRDRDRDPAGVEPEDGAEAAAPDLPFVFERRADGALAGAAYAEALWRQAIQWRKEGRLVDLAEVLDRLLAIEPSHRAARAWRQALPRMQRDQRRAAERLLRDRLDRLAPALEGRRIEVLQALWAGRLDPSTRDFLGRLYADRSTLRVTLRPRWFEVDGRSSIRFGVSVTVERRGDRGRRDVMIDRYDWSGRLEDGHFIGPFPG